MAPRRHRPSRPLARAAPPSRGRRGVLAHALAVVLLVALLTAGCGVPVQDRSERVDVPMGTTTSTGPPARSGGADVEVYFIRGTLLEPVRRSPDRPDPQGALDELVAGPTRTEVIEGLRTAVIPQPLVAAVADAGARVVTVDVTREFTDVTGGNQIRAVAQVVWTVTQFPDTPLVRFRAEGDLIEVPTDEGLTDQPVSRTDYRSVAPAD